MFKVAILLFTASTVISFIEVDITYTCPFGDTQTFKKGKKVVEDNICSFPDNCNRNAVLARTDGCSADCPSLAPGLFEEACNMHDLCYAAGVDRVTCNTDFRNNMYAFCAAPGAQHDDTCWTHAECIKVGLETAYVSPVVREQVDANIKWGRNNCLLCPYGYYEQDGHIPGFGGIQDTTINNDCTECADLCSSNSLCLSYECSKRHKWCGLNNKHNPTSNLVVWDYIFCSKDCPPGYEKQDGHTVGVALRDITIQNNCEECGDECSSLASCLSFECSFKHKKCFLFEEPNPTGLANPDYAFCTKSIQSSIPGYFKQDGHTVGVALRDITIQNKCEECGDECSSLGSCLSFECSVKYKKCFLFDVPNPKGAEPNPDYVFYTKEEVCAHGYVAQSGDSPQWGSVDGAGEGDIVSNCNECANLCTSRSTCLSYECNYGASTNKCNLNVEADPSEVWFEQYVFCSKDSGSPGKVGLIGGILGDIDYIKKTGTIQISESAFLVISGSIVLLLIVNIWVLYMKGCRKRNKYHTVSYAETDVETECK